MKAVSSKRMLTGKEEKKQTARDFFFFFKYLPGSQCDANGIPEHKRVHFFQSSLLQILATDGL